MKLKGENMNFQILVIKPKIIMNKERFYSLLSPLTSFHLIDKYGTFCLAIHLLAMVPMLIVNYIFIFIFFVCWDESGSIIFFFP